MPQERVVDFVFDRCWPGWRGCALVEAEIIELGLLGL